MARATPEIISELDLDRPWLPSVRTLTMLPRPAAFRHHLRQLPAPLPLARHHSTLPLPPTIASTLPAAAAARPASEPSQVTLHGWVRTCRRQKNVAFAVVNDGSDLGGVQVVLRKGLEEG